MAYPYTHPYTYKSKYYVDWSLLSNPKYDYVYKTTNVKNPLKFGIYRGKDITDPSIPESYFEFIIAQQSKTLKEFEVELERRRTIEKATDSMAAQIISAGFKALALKYHPDQGGNPETFQELLGTRAILTEVVEKLK